MEYNPILSTDSYKLTHHKMYPPNTEYVYSYLEARRGGEYSSLVFFGLQYILNKHFKGSIITRPAIEAAANFCQNHFGQDLFNREGWEYILNKHNGCLPVRIRAVPEGTVVPESNVLLTIENTDPKCAWITNHCETLLMQLWYPCTIATISRENKKWLHAALEKTGNPENIGFMLHDFGFRGSTSHESAAIGGAAHLVNFLGTDTIAAIELLKNHYEGAMTGYSVPAAEHSTITAWGRHREKDAYENALKQYPSGIVSMVSDSWDIYDACSELWGGELRDLVRKGGENSLAEGGQKLVVRPDSGDPEIVVNRVLDILGDKFGYSLNEKGYKELPPYVGVIQGDGIDRRSLPNLIESIMSNGWSLNNIVFGSGGGLLQDCNRDTLRFALKCSWTQADGVEKDVYKQPSSDPSKDSKRGRLKLVSAYDSYETVPESDHRPDLLREVFLNGRIFVQEGIDRIRKRAAL